MIAGRLVPGETFRARVPGLEWAQPRNSREEDHGPIPTDRRRRGARQARSSGHRWRWPYRGMSFRPRRFPEADRRRRTGGARQARLAGRRPAWRHGQGILVGHAVRSPYRRPRPRHAAALYALAPRRAGLRLRPLLHVAGIGLYLPARHRDSPRLVPCPQHDVCRHVQGRRRPHAPGRGYPHLYAARGDRGAGIRRQQAGLQGGDDRHRNPRRAADFGADHHRLEAQLVDGEFQLLDRLLRRIGGDNRDRAHAVADALEHVGIHHVEGTARGAANLGVVQVDIAQSQRRVAMGEVEAQLVEARAHIARQHGEGAVVGMGTGRHAAPESLDRGAMRAADRPGALGALRQFGAGDLLQEIVEGEMTFRDMAIAIDDRMIELGAHLGADDRLELAHDLPPASFLAAPTLAPEPGPGKSRPEPAARLSFTKKEYAMPAPIRPPLTSACATTASPASARSATAMPGRSISTIPRATPSRFISTPRTTPPSPMPT